MFEQPPAPSHSDTASAGILAKAIRATMATAQTHGEDEDLEKRHARHDERERDRALSRDRWRLLDPVAWWSDAEKADLDYEVSRSGAPSFTARRMKLPAVSVNPFGSRRPDPGPRADPFGVFDSLGRPRQHQVSTTGLSTADAAAAYKRILCANAMGLVFSTHLTITWSMVGVHTDRGVHDGLRKVFAVLRDLNRRNVAQGRAPLVWVWTLERSSAKGLHSHVIVACDPQRRGVLLRAVARAIRDHTGRTAAEVSAGHVAVQSQASAVPTKPDYAIAMTSPPKNQDGSRSQPREMRAQWALWRYIFKGVQPSPWDGKNWMFRTLARSPQGIIQGRRWGYSTATLGDTAWSRYAQAVDGDPEGVGRFVDRLSAIEYPEGIDVYSPIWSA